MSEIAKLPSWVRTEYHQKDTCAIWVVTVKDRHGKWHVYEVGAVGGHGSTPMAKVRAESATAKLVEDVRQAFKSQRDDTTNTRSCGHACWWSNPQLTHHRLTSKGIELLWESGMTIADFYDHAHAVLQLGDDDAPTD